MSCEPIHCTSLVRGHVISSNRTGTCNAGTSFYVELKSDVGISTDTEVVVDDM